jgi:hypothetical protein
MDTLWVDRQLSAVKALGRMPGLVHVSPIELRVEGWALLLWDHAERPRLLILNSFKAILDWGHGAGHVTRYRGTMVPGIAGVDIDPRKAEPYGRLKPGCNLFHRWTKPSF